MTDKATPTGRTILSQRDLRAAASAHSRLRQRLAPWSALPLLVLARISFAQCEIPNLTPSDGASGDAFGTSAGISGGTIVVGSPEDDDAGSSSGSAYVFTLNGGLWTQQAKLTAPDAASLDRFGFAVAASGNVIVVGSPRDDDAGSSSGSAYVYRFNGTSWAFEQKLVAPDAAADDRFGTAVAIDGTSLLVGSPQDDDVASDSGSAYFYQHNGATWVFQAKFAPTDLDDTAQFGRSVALRGDAAIVGAWQAEPPGMFLVGSAYVFRRTAGVWAQEQKLMASDAADFRWFGYSVAIDGDAAAVGAWGDRGADLSESGGAYFFRRTGGIWIEEANVNADPPVANDRFGWSIALEGDTAVIGTGISGLNRAYRFTRSGGIWSQTALLATSDPNVTSGFGQAAALQGSTAVVTDLNSGGPGAAYLFDLAGADCNGNGACDSRDIDDMTSRDCDANAVPDECEPLGVDVFVDVLLDLDDDPNHVCLADVNADGDADGDDIALYLDRVLPEEGYAP